MVVVELLPEYMWFGTALFSLVFGGIMIFFYLYSALGSSDLNDSPESIDSELEPEIGVETDMGTDVDANLDADLDTTLDADSISDIDAEIEVDLENLSSVESAEMDIELEEGNLGGGFSPEYHTHFSGGEPFGLLEGFDAPPTVIVEGSNVLLPSISGATLTYGLTGVMLWFNSKPTDQSVVFALLVAIIGGLGMSKAMRELTKGYMTPVTGIQRGNYATVIYEVTPTKSGLVSITQRDGSSRKAIAIGAFPHDFFGQGEKGLVWEAKGSIVKITREFQPSAPYKIVPPDQQGKEPTRRQFANKSRKKKKING